MAISRLIPSLLVSRLLLEGFCLALPNCLNFDHIEDPLSGAPFADVAVPAVAVFAVVAADAVAAAAGSAAGLLVDDASFASFASLSGLTAFSLIESIFACFRLPHFPVAFFFLLKDNFGIFVVGLSICSALG